MGGYLRFVFAGGGTGGHLFPAVAVAEQLRRLEPGCEVRFLCTERPIDREILVPLGLRCLAQPVQPWPTNPMRWPAFVNAWRRSVRLLRDLWRDDPPSVVTGSGGFGAGPAIRTAASMGIPSALLNPDAIPGRANRFLARKVRVVFAQWVATSPTLMNHAGLRVTGCPVRSGFLKAARQAGVERFGLDPDRRTLVVTGASQGARTVNRALKAVLPHLARLKEWQVVHLSGPGDEEEMRQAYLDCDVPGSVVAFTTHMADLLAAADLVLSRAGASTLAELTVLGKASVLMPYPFHRDQHQLANARQLADAGAARIVIDRVHPHLNAETLAGTLIPLMRDPGALAAMSQAARALARPEAAATVAGCLLELAGAGRRCTARV